MMCCPGDGLCVSELRQWQHPVGLDGYCVAGQACETVTGACACVCLSVCVCLSLCLCKHLCVFRLLFRWQCHRITIHSSSRRLAADLTIEIHYEPHASNSRATSTSNRAVWNRDMADLCVMAMQDRQCSS